MFTCAVKNVATWTLIKTTGWRLVLGGTTLPFKRRQLPLMHDTNHCMYSAPVWHKPLGDVPLPRRETLQAKSAEVVPLESIVDRRSLLCLEQIHDACTPNDIYQALGENRGNLNEVHIARAMAKLAAIQASTSVKDHPNSGDLTKVKDKETGNLTLQGDKLFGDLCKLALQHAKAMDSKLFVMLVKAVIELGVPHSSAMVQTLLAGAEHRLNQFDFDDLSRLASQLVLLHQTDPRVQALLQAVQLLIPDRIGTCTNAMSLTSLLRTVGKHLDHHVTDQIGLRLLAILRTKQTTEEDRTAVDAAEAVSSFHIIGYRNVQFLNEAFEILLNGIEYLPPAKLVLTLRSTSGLRYYHPQFLEEVGDLVADKVKDFTLYQLSRILQTYSFHRRLHEKLLDSVATFLINSRPRPLDQEHVIALFRILSPYAKLQYVPSACGASLFDLLSARLEEELDTYRDTELNSGQLVTLVALLAECRSYSPKLLETVLRRRSYEACLEDPKTAVHVRTLFNIITIDKPEMYALASEDAMCGSRLEELSDALDRANLEKSNTRRNGADEFKKSVAKLLTGVTENSRFSIATDVDIRSGYTIDFVVFDQKQERTRMALCLTRPSQYCANYPDRLLGREAIKQRHLAASGYTVHTISKMEWLALESAAEQAGYMKQLLCL